MYLPMFSLSSCIDSDMYNSDMYKYIIWISLVRSHYLELIRILMVNIYIIISNYFDINTCILQCSHHHLSIKIDLYNVLYGYHWSNKN